ncbi:MAG: ABC transporter ATP-binding protein [Proteobacteria bacterium]|nr:ABC transporter ATP-binding protein [Pseudomonadota bacterium]
MIEVSGLSKRYGDIHALADVSFSVDTGKIVGFLGANGAGKSTTMDILCGYIGADQGTAKIAGFDITDQPIEAKYRLGYLPDVPPLHTDMTVSDFITYAARLRKVESSKVKTRVDSTLEKLALGEVRKRLVGNLSKGYRQRVGLAQALVHDPEVLVLDEPTEGLDPTQISEMRKLIRGLAGQHTILLSSHILSEVQSTVDKIVVINKGRIVAQGSYEELASSLEGGSLYRLRVAKQSERALAILNGINGVYGAKLNSSGEEIEFAIAKSTSDGIIDDIARGVIDGGCGLREVSLKTRSLEDVFLQLTK